MNLMSLRTLFALMAGLLALASCTPSPPSDSRPSLVVTYSLLGSLVKDLAGDDYRVTVLMPNGLDPHEWEPSARDIETLNKASLVVANGLNLEGGLEGALEAAANAGVPFFFASDYLTVRTVKPGQGLPTGDPDQAPGASDPHLWLDPVRLTTVMTALADELKTRFGTDLSVRAADLNARLTALAERLGAEVATLPEERRLLVTGHESLGYFAEAFGLRLIGAIIPSLSTRAEVSASDMANLKTQIQGSKVTVIFSEQGTPPKVAQALADETGIHLVPLNTHSLPADGSYFTFLETLTQTVVEGLKGH